jgi:hypothetical protein
MALLNKEQVLAAQDLHYEVVLVPEWDGELRLRSMTGAERDLYEQSFFTARADEKAPVPNVRARLVAFCAVDEAGNRMFSDADVEALGAKSARALERVYQVATKLNAVTDKDIEELGKAYAPTTAAASTSSSPSA